MTLNYREMFARQMGLPCFARYEHPEKDVARMLAEIRAQHPEHSAEEVKGRALARLDALQYHKAKKPVLRKHNWKRWLEIAVFFGLLLAVLFLAKRAHGQSTVIRGAAKGTTAGNNATVTSVDSNHNAIDVNVAAGGGTGGGPADTAPNAAASESDVARQKVTSAIRVLDTGQSAGSQLVTAKGDQSSGMWVNCKAGCSAAGDTSTGSTALGAANAVITIALAGERGATFQLQSAGTGVYTVTPQCSFDGGTLYNVNGYIQDPFSGVVSTTATIASAQATTDYPVMCPQGASHAQMKVTAYTSGSANWLARAAVVTWPNLGWGIVSTAAPSYTTGQINGFSLTLAGALRVDNSGVTQPVSGTFWQATQPVSSTQLPAALDGSGFLKTHEQGTATVSGTVTANAGTNLNTSALALDTSVNGVLVSQGSTTSGQKGPLVQGAVTTAAPSYTTAQTSPLSLNTAGGLRVDGSGVTQPVSGTVTTTPPANASTNVAQFGGTNVSTGTGAGGAGIPRVTISNDSSLAANQSVNVSQINAVTPLMGNGATGTGSPRTTISNDNTGIANWGHGATGSAPPTGGTQIMAPTSGATGGLSSTPIVCDGYAKYDAATNGATELVALSSSRVVYVCGYSFTSSSSTANTIKLVYGTGTACATGQTAMTPGYVLQAAASTGPIGKVVPVSGWARGLKTAASNALCILTNAAQAAQAEVWYAQF